MAYLRLALALLGLALATAFFVLGLSLIIASFLLPLLATGVKKGLAWFQAVDRYSPLDVVDSSRKLDDNFRSIVREL